MSAPPDPVAAIRGEGKEWEKGRKRWEEGKGGIRGMPTSTFVTYVALTVCLSVTTVSPIETVELIKMTFGVWTRIPREAAFKV